MKLNKFLAVAVAATVLPLSVAHAVEEAPVLEKPEVVLDSNGQPVFEADGKTPVLKSHGTPAVENKEEFNAVKETTKVRFDEKTGKPVYYSHGLPTSVEKSEFKGGVNGAEPAVAEKPEYKAEEAQKPATPAKKVLPKTSAAK